MRAEQFLSEGALRFGSRPAIVADGRPHSYADLARNSDRVAAALMSRGDQARRSRRASSWTIPSTRSCPPSPCSRLAALSARSIRRAMRRHLEQALDQSRAVGIVTDARHASVAAAAMTKARSIRLVLLCGGGGSMASDSCLSYEDLVGGIGSGPSVVRAGAGSDAAILLQPSLARTQPRQAHR